MRLLSSSGLMAMVVMASSLGASKITRLQHPHLRFLHLRDQFLHNHIDRDAFGFGVEGGDEAVAEGWKRESFDIVGGDVGAAVEEGADFACKHQHLAGARTGP